MIRAAFEGFLLGSVVGVAAGVVGTLAALWATGLL